MYVHLGTVLNQYYVNKIWMKMWSKCQIQSPCTEESPCRDKIMLIHLKESLEIRTPILASKEMALY